MIEMGKKYQTRDGRAVRILCVDRGQSWPVLGLVTDKNGDEHVGTWDVYGMQEFNEKQNLVPVPTKHEAWGIIRDGMEYGFNVFLTKKDALAFCSDWIDPWHIVLVTWED